MYGLSNVLKLPNEVPCVSVRAGMLIGAAAASDSGLFQRRCVSVATPYRSLTRRLPLRIGETKYLGGFIPAVLRCDYCGPSAGDEKEESGSSARFGGSGGGDKDAFAQVAVAFCHSEADDMLAIARWMGYGVSIW